MRSTEKMLISDFLNGIHTVAISGHVNPDGDCVGSILAVYGYIRKNHPEIEADIFLEKPTDKLAFLKYIDVIDTEFAKDRTYDLMICVDCASLERLGGAVKYFRTAAHTINIDHHVSNPGYADENYVFGGLSSCCEALYSFMDPEKIDKDMAISLYTGIIYDTGVFKYDATTPATMRVAADLLEYGIDTNFIIDESFYAKTYDENRILGHALEKSRLACGGKVIYSWLTNAELDEYGVSASETEGIVAQLKLTKDIHIAIFVRETAAPGELKVSFRSDDTADVNVLASSFGGGGHVRASGATYKGTVEDCIADVLKAAEDIL
ncbi:MAG: bifunctional oligoribonuclease/PAP phosphatase NrnA [Lachnospiraceae bacterium]|nr:bifunctional oligoribonuclease/PAP phosphatase NrnA [Lachnospiraceae bacterium]